MSVLEEKLQNWIIHETTGLCEGRMKKVPHVSKLSELTEGKNKKIWRYVIKHVKSRHAVEDIKKVLLVKRAQHELPYLYPPTDRYENATLKQEIVKAGEKLHFTETSFENITKDVISLKEVIQTQNNKNSVITQRCSFLELVALNYHAKNENLKTVLEKLCSLLNNIFSSEKSKCFQNLIVWHSLEVGKSNKFNLQADDSKIKSIICQMSSAVEKDMSNEDVTSLSINLVNSVVGIMSCTSVSELLNALKQMLKQSESSLKQSDSLSLCSFSSFQERKVRMSEKCLQEMKLDNVNSCFYRKKMLNLAILLPSSEEILSSKKFLSEPEVQQELFVLKLQNECLRESIKYLEQVLSEEFDITRCTVKKNNEQRIHCLNLKIVMQSFYKKLESMHMLLNTTQQTFSDIREALVMSNEFLCVKLIDCMISKGKEYFSDVKNNMQNDYEMSLALVKRDDNLKGLLDNSAFENENFPKKIWKLLAVKPFQNCYRICEKLIRLKNDLFYQDEIVELNTSENLSETFFHLMTSIQAMTEQLKSGREEVASKTKEDAKCLKGIVEEWWDQKAQFIPAINYGGKSLKMWIDILCILEDF